MSNVNNILLDNKTLETLDRTCGVDHTSHTPTARIKKKYKQQKGKY